MPVALLLVALMGLPLSAGAVEAGTQISTLTPAAISPPLPPAARPHAPLSPEQQVAATVADWAQALQKRDGDAALARLTTDQQATYQANAKTYLKVARVRAATVYNHQTLRILDTRVSGDEAIHKIQLRDRGGQEALGIIHLQRDATSGTWRIDRAAFTLLGDDRGV